MSPGTDGGFAVDSTALTALGHRLRTSAAGLSALSTQRVLSRAAGACPSSATADALREASSGWSGILRELTDSMLDSAASLMAAAAVYAETDERLSGSFGAIPRPGGA